MERSYSNSDMIRMWSKARELALSDYIDLTQAACLSTKVYRDSLENKLTVSNDRNRLAKVSVINLDIISAGINLHHQIGAKVAILNFADGTKPGGWGELGARTQEECLCRSSNLYETLLQVQCISKYYNYNKHTYGENSGTIIYSPNVYFFKKGVDYKDTSEYLDVITCAASKVQMEHPLKEYERRITNILNVCVENDLHHLVLGAWGCGAFNQNPFTIAKAFCNVLNKYGHYFDDIVFAIIDTPTWSKDHNYAIFKEVFDRTYLNIGGC